MEKNKRGNSYELTEIAMFVVILVVCSWISIPTVIPFTLQTFAIFLAICMLGGKKTTMVVLIYLLMGSIGIPVFSGFCGGIGCLVGNTGGFLVGFLFAAVIVWAVEYRIVMKPWVRWLQMILCIVICYVLGVTWYLMIMGIDLSFKTVIPIISIYVIPFIVPDIVKMYTAYALSKRLKRMILNL